MDLGECWKPISDYFVTNSARHSETSRLVFPQNQPEFESQPSVPLVTRNVGRSLKIIGLRTRLFPPCPFPSILVFSRCGNAAHFSAPLFTTEAASLSFSRLDELCVMSLSVLSFFHLIRSGLRSSLQTLIFGHQNCARAAKFVMVLAHMRPFAGSSLSEKIKLELFTHAQLEQCLFNFPSWTFSEKISRISLLRSGRDECELFQRKTIAPLPSLPSNTLQADNYCH